MYAKLSRYVRVYVSQKQMDFLYKYEKRFPILQSRLDVNDIETAQTLSSKGILVRKKFEVDTQYNLNKSIRFENGTK